MPKPCSYEGCEKLTRSRGLCGGHYRQWSKGQDLRPLRPMRKPYASLEEGFFADVRESATGCWDWVGATTPGGYGIFWKSGGAVMAHRWAYEFLRTTIPEGLEIDHLCRNRACVNPWHLEPVTHAVNVERGNAWSARNRRKTHCVHGHEFNEANTMWRGETQRRCRACHKIQSRRANRKAAA